MTTGKLPWNASAVNVSFDRYDFIWYSFSKQGYRTLYSEDAPFGQLFDYQKAGFAKPQSDYFDRPFSVAMEGMSDIWNTNHHCVHARPETQIVLDYSKQFIHEFKSSPYFGFTFITRLTQYLSNETLTALDFHGNSCTNFPVVIGTMFKNVLSATLLYPRNSIADILFNR
jgi:hypothetical protein